MNNTSFVCRQTKQVVTGPVLVSLTPRLFFLDTTWAVSGLTQKKKGFLKKLIRKFHAIIKYSYVPSSHTNRQRPKMQAHYG